MEKKSKFKQTEIGMIPEDWEVKTISQVAEVVGGGTPSTKNPEYWNGKISWLTPKDLSNYKFKYIEKGERSITEEGLNNSSAKLLPKNTVLLTTRAPVGYVAISSREVCTNQGFRSLVPKPDESYHEFLYYLLKLKRDYLKSQAFGSTFGELSGTTLKNLKFAFPSLPEQRAIAKILSDLDAKIELLQKQNETLEKIGQAIFKHWFVDFEFPNEEGKPYKSSGGEMVYNEELGKEIPKGWRVGNYGNILEFERGIEPGSKNYLDKKENNTILFYRVADLLNGKSEIYIKKELAKNKITKFENVLVSFDGTVGRVAIGINGAYSSGIRKVYDKNNYFSNGFIYFLMKSSFIQNKIKEFAKGTTILHAGEAIKHFEAPIPTKETIFNFDKIINPIYNKLLNNYSQIQTLQHIRDSLLPKLLSGKIRVPL